MHLVQRPNLGYITLLSIPLVAVILTVSYTQASWEEYFKSTKSDREIPRHIAEKEMGKIFFAYLKKVPVECRNKTRMGRASDGGWDICQDTAYKLKAPCIVYSFGINNDWCFDDAISATYGCQVFSFDPSMKNVPPTRGKLIRYYNIGVDGKDYVRLVRRFGNWTMKTVSSIRKMLGHQQKIIDVYKMDVEGSEWNTMTAMFKNGDFKTIKQFAVEVHFGIDPPRFKMLQMMKSLKKLETLGFQKFHANQNMACHYESALTGTTETYCHELYYFNHNFGDK